MSSALLSATNQLRTVTMRRVGKSCGKAITNGVVKPNAISKDIGIVGVPFAKGQPLPGVSEAPRMLREAGLISRLEKLGRRVHDYGDIKLKEVASDPTVENVKNPKTLGAGSQQVARTVARIVNDGELCLTIGGDHSLSIGSVFGHAQAQPDMTLIWVDAHTDINPPGASLSGNLHGMVISFLVHELSRYIPTLPGFDWISPCLHAKNIVFIGLRDIDPAERYIIDMLDMNCYTMHEVEKYGIAGVVERALHDINPCMNKPIHLSFDIDSLDVAVAPSTGTPVPGGLTLREGIYIAEELASTGLVTAVDLVEVNPLLGSVADRKATISAACDVIASCFGEQRRGNTPRDFTLTPCS